MNNEYDQNLVAKEIEANPAAAIPLTELNQYMPAKGGKRINYSTIWRWAQRGFRVGSGPNATRVVLETMMIGGMRVSTLAALNRFHRVRNYLAQCNSPRNAAGHTPRRTNSHARRFLEAEGFLNKAAG